ncbi:MAG: heavy metal translocating P-type ATPase [Promethearchaeota archaeon]
MAHNKGEEEIDKNKKDDYDIAEHSCSACEDKLDDLLNFDENNKNELISCENNGDNEGESGSNDIEHGNGHNESKNEHHGDDMVDLKKDITYIIVALMLFILGLVMSNLGSLNGLFYYLGQYKILGIVPAYYIYFLGAYLLAGRDVLKETLENIRDLKFLDENWLMTIASLGAIIIGNVSEGVAVMIFYSAGEFLENYSVMKSKRSIKALLDIKPSYANVIAEGCMIKVPPEKVKVGDLFIVNPGEKVPIDGIIYEGSSMLDTSALTGESIPKSYHEGDMVYAGSINLQSSITIKATKEYKDTSLARILEMVKSAEKNKAKTEKFITKFAKYYTPIVVFSAILIAVLPPLVINLANSNFNLINAMNNVRIDLFTPWIYRALVFLVISCPCALVISIPLGYFGGIGGASRRGILIKGANFIDVLAKADTILFDKTGTITKGNFIVSQIVALNGMDSDELIKIAAMSERFSNHPVAKSIVEYYLAKRNIPIEKFDISQVNDFSEIPSYGVRAIIEGKEVLIGNDKILHKFDIIHEHKYCNIKGTVAHVVYDREYRGYITIADELKEEAGEAIKRLKELGVKRIAIVSGDEKDIVENIASKLGLDEYYYGLLPEDKVKILEKAKENSESTIFVGDGINDAPVMASADVGIVMGQIGSEAAIETADVVIMTDNLLRVPTSIKLARKTRRIVWENLIFVFLVKIFFLTLGAIGLATMWEAVFADVGVALIAIFNAGRILHFQNKKTYGKKQNIGNIKIF